MATVEGDSVAPPGWSDAASTPATPTVSSPLPAMVQAPADAAVRWRISAAIIDNLIVYGMYLLACLVLHWRVANLEHLVALLGLGVVYHFALESRDGQTVGKRQYGIRVVSFDDEQAAPKAIAMRSALRIIDALPFWYLSGLVSMVRTGPSRRQRIGDVAAATKVVAIDGRSAARGTPGWMLPTATLVALAISALATLGIAEAGSRPLTSTQTAQWLAGCQHASAGVVDCRCLLNRLEADGYDNLRQLTDVVEQARAERLVGQAGNARTELTAVAVACRH
jgi:uncharacterized RDD family membrane protein YckC